MSFETNRSLIPILQVTGLTFKFGKRNVLNGLNFEVQKGEIFGLLGPNGSGKSTALAIIAGLLNRQGGTISMQGEVLPDATPSFRRQIGFVFQHPSLDLKLSARTNLSLACSLYGIPKAERKERIAQQLEFAGVHERADERVSKFSGGMRRKLDIARALIHDPSILLLDEPTVGLDEFSFRDTWQRLELIRKSKEITMILSTHRPEEGERCSRIAILNSGKTAVIESPTILKAALSEDVVVVSGENLPLLNEELINKFSLKCTLADNEILIECEKGHELIPRLVESFPHGRFSSISLRQPTLADLFLKITGHRLDEDAAPSNGDLK